MMPHTSLETFMETQFPVSCHADTQTGNPLSKGFPKSEGLFPDLEVETNSFP